MTVLSCNKHVRVGVSPFRSNHDKACHYTPLTNCITFESQVETDKAAMILLPPLSECGHFYWKHCVRASIYLLRKKVYFNVTCGWITFFLLDRFHKWLSSMPVAPLPAACFVCIYGLQVNKKLTNKTRLTKERFGNISPAQVCSLFFKYNYTKVLRYSM